MFRKGAAEWGISVREFPKLYCYNYLVPSVGFDRRDHPHIILFLLHC